MRTSGPRSAGLRATLVAVVYLLGACEAYDRSRRPQPVSLQNVPVSQLKDVILSRYFSNDDMYSYMEDYVKRCGHISRMFSIGKSASGKRDLWVLEISDRPGVHEAEPYIKFVANMHGNEPSGRQVLLRYAEWMCEMHSKDPMVARLVNDMHVMILPSMNPDGYDNRRRENARGRDLNRDFPDPIINAHRTGWTSDLPPSGKEQPETLALMKWAMQYKFIAGVSMHEGAVVANYPWDGSLDSRTHYSACPDDEVYKLLALTYAQNNPLMSQSAEFKNGITNGAKWYPLWGGMQDWNYLQADCMELTLELSQRKWPDTSLLPGIWADNKIALAKFASAAAFSGARGTVVAADPNVTPLIAKVQVAGIDKTITSSELGDFYRPLAPGNYTLTAVADGYLAQAQQVHVPTDGSGVSVEFVMPRSDIRAAGSDPQVAPRPEWVSSIDSMKIQPESAEIPPSIPQKVPVIRHYHNPVQRGGSGGSVQPRHGQVSNTNPRLRSADPPQVYASPLLSRALWFYVVLLCALVAGACIKCRRAPKKRPGLLPG